MTNTNRVATNPGEFFGLAVSKICQLGALHRSNTQGRRPACGSDCLEVHKLGELVDVAASILNDADEALSDYHEALVNGQAQQQTVG